MHFRKTVAGVSVHAMTGTYIVTLGMNASAEARRKLLGFAIRRRDKDAHRQSWMKGMRTFQTVYPNPPEGTLVSTRKHPIQDFLWSDFTAKAGRDYLYQVVPVRGEPENLEYGRPVEISVSMERERDGNHEVWFNR